MGEHYFVIDPTTKRLYKPNFNDGRVRLSIPLIKPIWRTEVAKVTKNRPIPEVIPSSSEEQDRSAAKVAQRILNAELERINYQELLVRMWSWVSAIGCAYLHPYWNKETQQIEVEVVPHIEVVVDPATRNSTKEANWLIHGKVLTPEQAYNVFGKEFKPTTSDATGMWQSLSMLMQGGIANPKQTGILVLRTWQRPSKKYPKGAVTTVIGDEVVENPMDEDDVEVFPYTHGELPFIDFHHVRIPGRYEGQSIIRDLWSSQKDYNNARSRMAETRALLAAPKMLAPEQSIDAERVTTTPGEIIFWKPIGPAEPKAMNPPRIPPFIFQTTDQAIQEMQDISGQHEGTKGQLAASGMPASAIIALQEADDTKLGPIISGLETGISRFGRQVLSLVQQYWTTQRIVQTWSEDDNYFIVDRFKGSDIRGQLDVKVIPGSALPKSKNQIRQDYLALWDRRIIQDPKDILRRLDLPESEGLFNMLEIDEKHALREHAKFAEGEEVLAEHWHNHQQHTVTHNNWRKTSEFEELPDEVRGMLADHVRQHEELEQLALQEQIQQQLQQQMAGMAAEQAVAPTPAGPNDINPNKPLLPDLEGVRGD